MKYLKPRTECLQAEVSELIAVSIINGENANNSGVLSKEDTDWDLWGDE